MVQRLFTSVHRTHFSEHVEKVIPMINYLNAWWFLEIPWNSVTLHTVFVFVCLCRGQALYSTGCHLLMPPARLHSTFRHWPTRQLIELPRHAVLCLRVFVSTDNAMTCPQTDVGAFPCQLHNCAIHTRCLAQARWTHCGHHSARFSVSFCALLHY